MEKYNKIIKETMDNYLNKNILKEYSNHTVYQNFLNAIDNLYRAYNQMIDDVNQKSLEGKASRNDFILKVIEKDINQLYKDIQHIK